MDSWLLEFIDRQYFMRNLLRQKKAVLAAKINRYFQCWSKGTKRRRKEDDEHEATKRKRKELSAVH